MSDAEREIGVECSCGFRRRATKIADRGERWNGREAEALHHFEITQEQKMWPAIGEGSPTHQMSSGLIAMMDWPVLTDVEQRIGEAWMLGCEAGERYMRDRLKARLDRVTAVEFGE